MMAPIVEHCKVTIADDDQVSSPISLDGYILVGMILPDITGTALTFLGAGPNEVNVATRPDDADYVPIVDSDGNTLTFTIADNTYIVIAPEAFLGVRWLKLNFTSNQAADRDVKIVKSTRGV